MLDCVDNCLDFGINRRFIQEKKIENNDGFFLRLLLKMFQTRQGVNISVSGWLDIF